MSRFTKIWRETDNFHFSVTSFFYFLAFLTFFCNIKKKKTGGMKKKCLNFFLVLYNFKSYAKFKQLKAIVFEWAVKIFRLGTTWCKSVLHVTCCQTFFFSLISYKPKDVYSVRYRTIRGALAPMTIADRMGS